MPKHQITASQLERADKCSWWLQDEREWFKTSSPAAELGTLVHKAIEDWLNKGTEEMPPEAVPRFYNWLHWWRDSPYKAFENIGVEQAFAYNVYTRKAEAITIVDRNYPHSGEPGWIYGTADLIQRTGSRLVVWDWKTGSMSVSSQSLQLKALALFASQAYGSEEVTAAVGQVLEDQMFANTTDMGFFDLEAVAEQLLKLYDRAFGAMRGSVEPCPGTWCKFCPVLAACPETQAVTGHRYLPVIQDHDHAKWLVHRMGVVKDATEQVGDSLKQWVDNNGPIELDKGFAYQGFGVGNGGVYKHKMYKLTKKV